LNLGQLLRLFCIKHNAEAQIIACISCRTQTWVVDTAVLRVIIPAAASKHTAVSVTIRSPLPNITAHIIYAEFVGLLLSDDVGSSAAVSVIPADDAQIIASAVCESAAFVASPCRKFPLRRRGQTSADFFAEVVSILPVYSFHRQVVAVKEGGVVSHNRMILRLRYGEFTDVEI